MKTPKYSVGDVFRRGPTIYVNDTEADDIYYCFKVILLCIAVKRARRTLFEQCSRLCPAYKEGAEGTTFPR